MTTFMVAWIFGCLCLAGGFSLGYRLGEANGLSRSDDAAEHF